jgi:hypothetical protein
MFERSERFERGGDSMRNLRQVVGQRPRGGNERIRGDSQASAQLTTPIQALAPTGTAPSENETRTAVLTANRPATTITEGLYQAAEPATNLAVPKTLRIYPFGVNRDRLAESARHLHVPVIITNSEKESDAVITLKNYYRRQPERLQQAEQERKLIIILKNNTVAQMQHALARIFDVPEVPSADEADGDGDGDGFGLDAPTKRAMLETEDAIHQVLNKGLTTAELAPANAYIRRLQHQMATRYNLVSRSRGKEPNRRVKIFRSHE